MQDSLALPGESIAAQGWATSGTWSIFQSADRMYSSRQEPFLATETNAGAIGGSAMNFPAYDGQWRQVAWAMVARGARMIEYWNWHTLHYGTETYWVGVLPHDQVPGRVYEQLSALGAELRKAGDLVAGLTPDAQVGLLYSNASKWGLAAQPALARGVEPDRDSYHRIVEAFYRGAFDARVPVRLVHDTQVVRDGTDLMDPGETAQTLPVLLVPALYIASDHLLEWLRRYAEAGGHLVLGPRSAYADEEARARLEVKPALLSAAAGVSYQEFTNLPSPVPVRSVGGALDLPSGALATGWADSLVVAGAEVIVEYEHPFVGTWPAVVTAAHGEGRVTTVGTVPDADLARALVDWLVPVADDAWRAVATASVTVYSATSGEGRRLRFLHNWSWEPTGVVVPVAVRDVLSDDIIERDHEVSLGPWDVRVLIEE
jgi:beta-galactosidase